MTERHAWAGLSARDRIRLDTAIGIAELFCAGPDARAKVVGSVALALHRSASSSAIRVPNDIDIVWRDDALPPDDEIRRRLRVEDGWRILGARSSTRLRTGPSLTGTYRIERWRGGLVDRIVLQECRPWPDPAVHEIVALPLLGREVSFAVEPLAWCVAHKLDALFKPRPPGWVSSRCRDLLDIALIDATSLEPLEPDLRGHVRRMGHGIDLSREPPAEWTVEWAKLVQETGVSEMSLEWAWKHARSLATQAADGTPS